MADETKLQVNVDFSGYPELYKELEAMVAEDMTDRSKFIRRLVQQEANRRAQMPLPIKLTKKGKAHVSTAVPA